MNILLTPFVYLAGLGLGLSFIVHVSSLTGVPLPLPFGVDLRLLNKVMFVVFTVAIIASNSITRGFKLNEFWKAALRACPKWMKYLPVFLLGYALFIAALAQILMSYYSAGGGNTTEITFKKQEGSAFSLALYSISMAMLYSAINARRYDEARRCPNGHRVSPSCKFCEECGAEVVDSQKRR